MKREGSGAHKVKKKKPVLDARQSFFSWANNFRKVMELVGRFDLDSLLDASDGVVHLRNFLPEKVARGAREVLEGIPESEWNPTEASRDWKKNDIAHAFSSTKTAEGVPELTRIFSLFYPDSLNSFSAARYGSGHFIEPHDDRAYTDVMLEDGSVVSCSRTVALVYYLTADEWNEEHGGVFVDYEGGMRVVPEFNSLVAFRVPRYHEVTRVSPSCGRSRYSVFGWFLQEGRLYELKTQEEEGQQGGFGKPSEGAVTKKTKKKKKGNVGEEGKGEEETKKEDDEVAQPKKKKKKSEDIETTLPSFPTKVPQGGQDGEREREPPPSIPHKKKTKSLSIKQKVKKEGKGERAQKKQKSSALKKQNKEGRGMRTLAEIRKALQGSKKKKKKSKKVV
uniref:Prolyl 4-hydroxylase alpha subunit domain-containing protein n=1 Tax=Chromera velia CCMP2878 TaxID=1169474 RepID=A0A0G4I3J3_9ALVE|mmetsp:Transcript_16217/g.32842  ORF Transcript_16217/g.32842 Transcript_16217/m.32842 type:complete len:392 (+) Transcript_16217:182-1357(+)|eukprot:Cvel_1764.t1-p1 / transcript=Cvel_1764.t1 / gene=Cvel_1764 / organism=Chromera_velia_CCMP2878 / gene_product=hypothetical protein / transcript_product=hypothetical protein / location=Cvel_scaffold64:106889-108703(-) / protein_length=391 / sequence_SO=supercontig / SO=protein_coding / is_pseudo=false